MQSRRSVFVEGLRHGNQPIPMASRRGPFVASGGISPVDIETGEIPSEPQEQVRHAFANLERVLSAAGASPADVIKVTVFVTDRSLRDAINVEWLEMFPDENDRPARHTLTQQLPGTMELQLEVLAVCS